MEVTGLNTVARWATVLVALALLAAACGDDTATSPAVETTTTVATTTAPDGQADSTTTVDATPTTEPVELTASFRGVTEDTIRVGVFTFDWDRLAAFGVKFGVTNAGDMWEAALLDINERGGIHGRQIEVYVTEFLPAGSDESDRACVELTEDHEVFVVIGTSLNEQILCVTELHETAAIVAGGMTDERLAKARAPYATFAAPTAVRAADAVALIESTGVLDGATIGVTGSTDVSATGFQAVADAFVDAGFDVVEALTGGAGGDLTEIARDQAILFERMVDRGVDVTVSTTGVPLEIANAIESGYASDQWVLTTIMSGRGLRDEGVPWSYLDGAIGVTNTKVGSSAQPELADEPLVAECLDFLIEETGQPIFYELDVEVNNITQGLVVCNMVKILEEALLNAGPMLTNESFQAGIEAIGEIELAGYTEASLGPGDLGAVKGLRLVEFDGETGAWNPLETG
jgi:hypothetical protein